MSRFDMPIINMLLAHSKNEKISLHMPGHKAGMVFSLDYDVGSEEISDLLLKLSAIGKYDVTELPDTDNLHNPRNVMKTAMKMTADVYSAYMSYFIVNGSTCGIHAMIYSAFRRGDTVFVASDCHMSVFNALMVLGCKIVIIPVVIDEITLLPLALTSKDVLKAYEKYPDSKGLILSRPNYYGVCANLKEISDIVHNKEGLLLVDEAHGGHFGFSDVVPERALKLGADMCVQSAHKTLQSFNQGAFLHISDKKYEDRVFKALKIIETTSPSFIVLATLDFTREYMKNLSMDRLLILADAINLFKERIKPYDLYTVFEGAGYEKDITKLVIYCKGKGKELHDLLMEDGIYAEMYNESNVVFILTCIDDYTVLNRLFKSLTSERIYDKLLSLVKDEKETTVIRNEVRQVDIFDFDFYIHSGDIRIPIEEATGRTCAQFVIPYPPGIPVVFPGEIINESHVHICTCYCIDFINVIK